MNRNEQLQQVFNEMEKEWATPQGSADEARAKTVNKLKSGEVVRFEFHEFNDHEPVDRVMEEAGAIGQCDLGLFIRPLLHVWIPKNE